MSSSLVHPTLPTVPLVSIVIVTRNRSQILAECLAALASQTSAPVELVVIDNASTDGTAPVVAEFKSRVAWSVRRIVETKLGYPAVYNRGLRSARSDWAIFIDDDCVAAQGWLAAFQRAIGEVMAAEPGAWRALSVAALVGQSQTRQPATVWSLAVLCADQLWKRNSLASELKKNKSGQYLRIVDLETLDNKNIAYYLPFLRRNNIAFNETVMNQPGGGAAEDADLGMQLAVNEASACYVPDALVWHRDPAHFSWYWRRLLSGALATFWYRRRWQKQRAELGLTQRQLVWRFRTFWPVFCAEQNLTGGRAVAVWLIVSLSFWLVNLYQSWLGWKEGQP